MQRRRSIPRPARWRCAAFCQNPKRQLLPGYFVRVRVPMSNEPKQMLLVPDVALGSDQSGRYVLMVNGDNVVEQRKVTVGPGSRRCASSTAA